MKTKFDSKSGETTVTLEQNERTAIAKAAAVCGKLGAWLDDENAKAAGEDLEQVLKDYATK